MTYLGHESQGIATHPARDNCRAVSPSFVNSPDRLRHLPGKQIHNMLHYRMSN